MEWRLPDDGQLELRPEFIPAEDCASWFERLLRELPLEQRPIRILGRAVLQPRLTAWIGAPEAIYTYSGVRHAPLPWSMALAQLRGRVAEAAGVAYNSVLCNLYRDGRDSMGMHADRERELGPNPVIASLSLGAVRRFQLRHRKHKQLALELDLPDGSLLIMRGALQHHYRHGVPKQPQISAPRLNLTFRRIEPS